ncbi:MAG: rhodanese-like domain-containing protein [Saprospiraceae bacterium]
MKNQVSLLMILLILSGIQISSAQIKMNANQFDSLLSKNKFVQLIDVRTPGEVSSGYIKGAVNINYSDPDFIKKINALDKTKPVAVYCAAGGRSGMSALKLKELGFTQIYDFTTGMTEWKAKNKPVETGSKR